AGVRHTMRRDTLMVPLFRRPALYILLCLLFQWTRAEACSCRPKPSVPEALAASSHVFWGCVASTYQQEGRSVARFSVFQSWKGVAKPSFDLFSGGVPCAFAFREAHCYLVYSDGKGASICSRTTEAPSFVSDMVDLGEPRLL